MVSRLRISLSQKIAVCAIFLIGIFVTACSSLRLVSLVSENRTGFVADPTWDFVPSAVWSGIEINASIICACLPSMRPLLRLILHGNLDRSQRLRIKASTGTTRYARGSRTSSRRVEIEGRAWFGRRTPVEGENNLVHEEQELENYRGTKSVPLTLAAKAIAAKSRPNRYN